MSLLPRRELETITLCPHGGPNYAELERLGIDFEALLDFSVSSNPFGAPPGVKESLKMISVEKYPDSEAAEFRRQLADRLQISPQTLVVGSGSTELIRLAAYAFFSPADKVLIIEPTFGEYEVACQIVSCRILKQRLRAEDGFRLSIEETISLAQRHSPKGIFLCNPNNPTGQYLSRQEVERLLSTCSDSLLVLDEAYVAFADDAWSSLDLIEGGNLLILRSMTKDYALAGLRLGYGIAHPEIIAALRKICPPWNVNSVAQQAAVLALKESEYLIQCRAGLCEARNFLLKEFACLGLPTLPTQANFFLVKVGDAPRFRHSLLEKGILVRDCTSFGLPQYVRIAPLTLPECQRLVACVKEIIAVQAPS